LATAKLTHHKSQGTVQTPGDLTKAGGKIIRCEIHNLIISIWNKEKLSEE